MLGKLYGLGVGPGDPELLTLKAHRILQRVAVIAVPVSQRGEESLALAVAQPYLRPDQEILTLFMPMSRDRDFLAQAWDAAAGEIAARLRQGRDVAFLTLGDASLYSTYTYLMERVRASLPEATIETVPGITSFAAAAARLNLPLAVGDELLAIVPLLKDPEELRSLLPRFPNLVLMKVARQFDAIVAVLRDCGRLGDAHLISRCGMATEQVSHDLAAAVGQKQDYLSLVIVKGGSGE